MRNPWICMTAITILLCATFISSKTHKTTQHMKFRTVDALGVLANEFNDVEVFKKLLKPLLSPRMPDTPKHKIVSDFIIKTMEDLGWHVEVDEFQDSTPYGMKTFRNIIATYDPSLPRRLLLSAHYDSKNITDSKGNEFVGATDSSVPCAILLDVATQLTCSLRNMDPADRKSAKDITPQLVFFDGEEAYVEWTHTDSIYGSRHLANKWRHTTHPTDPSKNYLQSIVLFVLLDLIGTGDVNFFSFFHETDNYFEHLVKIENNMIQNQKTNAKGLNSRIATRSLPRNMFHSSKVQSGLLGSGGIEDDHVPFKKDVPILHLISYPFPKVWHEMTDNEKALDYDVIDNFNRIFRVFVADFLQLDAFLVECRRIKR